MGIPHIALEAGGVYHIYNHSVGSENLFREDENYIYFLNKIFGRILPLSELLSYCLMPNHFHLVVRFYDKKELLILWNEKFLRLKEKYAKQNKENFDHILIDELIIREFGNLFNSYVQAFNKKYRRRGSLFKESFQRKRIDSDLDLIRLICYVHNNPVAHGFTSRREDWKYSSYNVLLSDVRTKISRQEVLQLFGGRENFIFLHDRFLGEEL